MENNQNNQAYHESYYEDEISLRELIEVLLKEKFLIAGVTLVCIILAAVYTLGILKPAYKSESLLLINLEESVDTPYGNFKLPFKTMDEYAQAVTGPIVLNRTIQDFPEEDYNLNSLAKKITVEKIKDTSTIRIKVEKASPQEAKNLASVHTENYLDHIELLFARMAVDNFYFTAQNSQASIEKSLIKNQEAMAKAQELLEKTPKAINLENALISQGDYALFYSSKSGVDLSKIAGDKIINQELNPSWLKIQEQITDLEIARNNLENSQIENERILAELEPDKEALADYRELLQIPELSTGIADSMKNLVILVNRPEIEIQKVSPRNSLNLAIGAVLGLMLGVFAAFFKHYWQISK